MFILLQIFVANVLSRAAILATASLLSYRWLARLSEQLLAVACGLMISIALTHLIPEAFATHGVCPETLGWIMLGTVLLFLVLERFLMAEEDHCHGEVQNVCSCHKTVESECRAIGGRAKTSAVAMMTASGLHNFVDGVLIASTFMVNSMAGWLIAFAVMMHEIPQTTGYMVILKNYGLTQRKAFLFCLGAALMAVLGGILGWFAVSLVEGILPYALAVSASSFIFITFHCLMPEVFTNCPDRKSAMKQFALLLVGVLLSVVILSGHHHHGHSHDETLHLEETASETVVVETAPVAGENLPKVKP